MVILLLFLTQFFKYPILFQKILYHYENYQFKVTFYLNFKYPILHQKILYRCENYRCKVTFYLNFQYPIKKYLIWLSIKKKMNIGFLHTFIILIIISFLSLYLNNSGFLHQNPAMSHFLKQFRFYFKYYFNSSVIFSYFLLYLHHSICNLNLFKFIPFLHPHKTRDPQMGLLYFFLIPQSYLSNHFSSKICNDFIIKDCQIVH